VPAYKPPASSSSKAAAILSKFSIGLPVPKWL
jgi:hypothetical protein